LAPGHDLNLTEQSKTIYDQVNRLLNDLRDCTNDRLLLLLEKNQNKIGNIYNPISLVQANLHRLEICVVILF